MIKKDKPIIILYNFLFAISSSVVGAILASWPLLFIFVKLQNTNKLVRMSIAQVMNNYNQLMWYLLWPFKSKLQMSDFPTSRDAAEHFADCKKLFIFAFIVFIVCLSIYVFLKYKHLASQLVITKTWIIIFLILPILLLPFALSNFDAFFIVFHHLFFSNSNWLFDPTTDPIINVLTEEFFAACFAVGGVIYELYFLQKLWLR